MTTTTAEIDPSQYTVLSGREHPGTPLRVLQSRFGFFLGFLTEGGDFYSRESVHFPTKEDAAYQLDLLQMGSAPLNYLLMPEGFARSTEKILAALTDDEQHPVRQDTEADAQFQAPQVEERVMVSSPEIADDPIVKRALLNVADQLGIVIDDPDDVTVAQLGQLIDDAQTADAAAVTPPDQTETTAAAMPGDTD